MEVAYLYLSRCKCYGAGSFYRPDHVIALAVKKGTKVVSQKLNNVKHEPGFIGSIVSFIFKAASQVFAFLSEHTWVIILAVVAFFMEKMLKRRRR